MPPRPTLATNCRPEAPWGGGGGVLGVRGPAESPPLWNQDGAVECMWRCGWGMEMRLQEEGLGLELSAADRAGVGDGGVVQPKVNDQKWTVQCCLDKGVADALHGAWDMRKDVGYCSNQRGKTRHQGHRAQLLLLDTKHEPRAPQKPRHQPTHTAHRRPNRKWHRQNPR